MPWFGGHSAAHLPDLERRALLRNGFLGLGLLASGSGLLGCRQFDIPSGSSGQLQSQIPFLGPLESAPDANGLRLPAGFTSRVVARSGVQPVAASSYVWHAAPDGGACFPTGDGGWIYVSNSERWFTGGGVGALQFSDAGEIVDARSLLTGTSGNCAGGVTPWGTWLSCEEDFYGRRGRVFECDPAGLEAAIPYPAMGLFVHEAAAVDPATHQIYMTEDRTEGGFYRFTPSDPALGGRPDLSSGTLEIALVDAMPTEEGASGSVTWTQVPIPAPALNQTQTKDQVSGSAIFSGGEGIWYSDGFVYFATKHNRHIWAYDIAGSSVSLFYKRMPFSPDNVTVSGGGDVLVAEDGPGIQLAAITPGGALAPLVQVVDHPDSEITGPAFDPSGTRLYFSSQRGSVDDSAFGITYEVTGPFVA